MVVEVKEPEEVRVGVPRPNSPWQDEFVRCTVKRQVAKVGRRGGKTFGVAIKACLAFLGICWGCLGEGCTLCDNTGKTKQKRVLYAAPTAEQVTKFWFEVVDTLSPGIESGIYKKDETEHVIEIPRTEIRIKAKTAWNANTMRGDWGDVVIMEEYQLWNEDAWQDVVQPMLLDTDGTAIFIYTPPSLKTEGVSKAKDPRHASKLFKKALEDKIGRWQTFHATSHDNPSLSKEALTEITTSGDMSEDSYRREIMAEDDEIEASWLVYSKFDESLCKIKRFEIPSHWPVYTGHDFGCVDEETEILTKNGWKHHTDLTERDITLTINPKTKQSEWQPVLKVNRYNGKHDFVEMRLIEQRGHSSFSTCNHRWLIEQRVSGENIFRNTEDLKRNDRIIAAARCSNLPIVLSYSDSFVELIAYFWTEGQMDAGGVSIWQNEGETAEQIRQCLVAEYGEPLTQTRNGRERAPAGWLERPNRDNYSPKTNRYTGEKGCHFAINLNGAERILEVAPKRVVKSEFIAALTLSQLELFIKTSLKVEGWQRRGRNGNLAGQSINQSKKIRLEPFQMACSLLGVRTNLTQATEGRSLVSLYKRNHLYLGQAEQKRIAYNGLVWCPTTPNGTWFARRNGTTYFTGNTANPAALFAAQVRLPLPVNAPPYLRFGDYVAFAEYAPGAGYSAVQHVDKFRDFMGANEDGTRRLRLEKAVGGNVNTEEETRQLYRRLGWDIRAPEVTSVKLQVDRAITIIEQNQFYVFEDLYGLLKQLAECMWVLDENNKPTNKINNEQRYHILSCFRYLASVLATRQAIGVEVGESRWD